MGTIQQTNGVFGTFKPELTRQFLPGCRNCGEKHPLAHKGIATLVEQGKVDPTICFKCGEPVQPPGRSITEKASFSWNPAVMVGLFLMWIGRKLGRLAGRI